MEIKNKTQLLEFIRKESLKFLKENQAFSSIEGAVDSSIEEVEKNLANIEKHYIEVSEKDYEKLKGEEKSAKEFNEFQSIKQQKVETLTKLINAYTKKIEYLKEIRNSLKTELDSGFVKDKEVEEFKNEDTIKGSTITLKTSTATFELKKSSDNNQYTVLSSDFPGVESGNILVLPDMQVGHPTKIQVYKKVGERFVTGSPTQIERVTQISKRI